MHRNNQTRCDPCRNSPLPPSPSALLCRKRDPVDDPLIWGAANIGRELSCGVREAFYVLEKGYVAADKIGGQWVARRSRLRAIGMARAMSGARHRRKGNRAERALVVYLQGRGFAAERVPLSGSAGGSFTGDVSVPLIGRDLRTEVKVRKERLQSTLSLARWSRLCWLSAPTIASRW